MRTKVFAMLLLLICLTGYSRFRYGMSGSMNLGYLGFGGNELTDYRSIARFGFSFGFAGEISLSERFYLQPELNLISKNYALDVRDFYSPDAEGYDRYSVLYLDLPVKVGINIGDMRLFGGGYFDYCLGGTNHNQIAYGGIMTTKSTDDIDSATEFTRKETDELFPLQTQHFMDGGVLVGIGRRHKNFSVDLSYAHGLVNVFPNIENTNFRQEHKMYIRSFALSLLIYL